MIRFVQKGEFKRADSFFKRLLVSSKLANIDSYAQLGVEALRSATPIESGETASSWGYEIERNKDSIVINWTNSNINDGANIAVLIQYGHCTGTGGYVSGYDYINPSIKPVFDQIVEEIRKEVRYL